MFTFEHCECLQPPNVWEVYMDELLAAADLELLARAYLDTPRAPQLVQFFLDVKSQAESAAILDGAGNAPQVKHSKYEENIQHINISSISVKFVEHCQLRNLSEKEG